MGLERRQGPDGQYLVRPRYRPEDYTVHPTAMASIENPLTAYQLAVAADQQQSLPVRYE